MTRKNQRKKSNFQQMAESPQNSLLIKDNLINRLNIQIKKLNFVKGVQNLQKDEIFQNISKIEEEAKFYQHPEIHRLAELAKGKRILNLEIERKRNQFQIKKQKKKIIEDVFRENRIKQVDYYELCIKKLRNKCFIVPPYSSGRGFCESDNLYTDFMPKINKSTYTKALQQSQYLETTKKINTVFFQNFSQGSSYHAKDVILTQKKYLVILFLLVIQIVLSILFFSFSISCAQYILLINTTIFLILLLWATISKFIQQTNSNFQLHETVLGINKYFDKLNSELRQSGKDIRWICPDDFLYLQIKFGQNYQLKD